MSVRRLLSFLLAPALMAGALVSAGCSRPDATPRMQADPASPAGRWYLAEGGRRLVLELRSQEGRPAGDIALEGRQGQAVERIDWDPAAGLLRFRTGVEGFRRWYRLHLADGVLRGRATPPGRHENEPETARYTLVVSGWHAQAFERDRLPRAWDLRLADGRMARVRIDRATGDEGGEDASVSLAGTFKVFASRERHSNAEEPEYPLHAIHWDGVVLRFRRHGDEGMEVYEATADGRHLRGRWRAGDDGLWRSLQGTRAELFGWGLRSRDTSQRRQWQAQTLRRVGHLLMAGAPAPEDMQVEVLRTVPARRGRRPDPGRDDLPERWSRDYVLDELAFSFTLDDGTGNPLRRHAHGWLARPADRGARRPAVIALNGHAGSAWQLFDPDAWMYWYGDALARRGFIVLGIDISHREYGDDPEGGNEAHPPVAPPGLPSEWEEDGERVYDVLRGLDLLLARDDVDPARVAVLGHSLGAEVALQAAAMDTRLRAVVATGFPADFQVMAWNGNHECWQWRNADINEYVDQSTYLALIAPRPLILQSAALDRTFSRRDPPFSADRQVVRRALAAWHDAPDRLIHLLHGDGHSLRAGTAAGGVMRFAAPPGLATEDIAWQTRADAVQLQQDLFELLADTLAGAAH